MKKSIVALLALSICACSPTDIAALKAELKKELQKEAGPSASPSASQSASPIASASPSAVPTAQPSSSATPKPAPTPTPDARSGFERATKVRFTKQVGGQGIIITPYLVLDSGESVKCDCPGGKLSYGIFEPTNGWELASGTTSLVVDKASFVAEGTNDNLHNILKTQPIVISYAAFLPNGKTLKGTMDTFLTSPPIEWKQGSTPASTPTSQPSVAPQPVATQIPILLPTPVPTPLPTPIPIPTINIPVTPVPAGYPIAVDPDKCRARIIRSYTGTGTMTTLDWSMLIPPKLTSTSEYGLLFRERLTTGYPSLAIFVNSLSPGTYTVNQTSALNKTSTAYMSYQWSASLSDTVIDDSTSDATVKIEGNQNGYIWGTLDGKLGKLGSRILITGSFSCKP